MTLPLFAAFPPAALRVSLGSQQWESALDVWISIADIWLNAPAHAFLAEERDHGRLGNFLISYYEEIYRSLKSDSTLSSAKSLSLRRRTFLLTHRLLVESTPKSASSEHSLLTVEFLGAFCSAHPKSQALSDLLQKVWRHYQPVLSALLVSKRTALTNTLESSHPNVVEADLRRLSPLLHSLPQAGVLMTEGSEFIDAMFIAYGKGSPSLRTALVPVVYFSLISLTKAETTNRSALLDHLYSLKSQADDATEQSSSLLADLVTNTPLLTKLPGQPGEKGAERARTLTAALGAFRLPSATRPRRRRQPSKGKGVAISDGGPNDDDKVQLMSRISQIQDLFPDLGAGFVSRLLSFYEQDVELATSQLLEDSLPPSLANLDRTLQLPSSPSASDQPHHDPPPPPTTTTSLPIRRNVFDNDALDRLAVPASALLHRGGRAATPRTADDELADRTRAPAKASILAALAAFDADDDERDDTYDAADVGGTVDPGAEADGDDDDGADSQRHEQALWRAWSADRAVFDRAARRTRAREDLKAVTGGCTDEMLEGWATMLARDPGRQRRLEARFAFAGAQSEVVGRTAYREGDEAAQQPGPAHRGGRGAGRGGRGGRGNSNVAGESSDAQTQTARHRKEAAKGSRANHNRRDQRARKMARGGFPG